MWYRSAGVVCLVAGTAWAFGVAPHALGSPVTGGMNLIFGPVLLLVLGVIWVTSPRIDKPPVSPEPAPATEHDEEASA